MDEFKKAAAGKAGISDVWLNLWQFILKIYLVTSCEKSFLIIIIIIIVGEISL